MNKSIKVTDLSNNGSVEVKFKKAVRNMTAQEMLLTGFGMFR